MKKIINYLSIPFLLIGSFVLISLGGAKERDKRHQESLKRKEQNKKIGARLDKKYEKMDASAVADRLNKL